MGLAKRLPIHLLGLYDHIESVIIIIIIIIIITYGCIMIAKLITDVDRVPALDCLVVTPSTSTCASSSGNQHELLASTKTAASVERSNMIRERKILYFGHFAKTIIQCVVVCLQNQPEVIGFLVSLGKVKVRQLYPVESG